MFPSKSGASPFVEHAATSVVSKNGSISIHVRLGGPISEWGGNFCGTAFGSGSANDDRLPRQGRLPAGRVLQKLGPQGQSLNRGCQFGLSQMCIDLRHSSRGVAEKPLDVIKWHAIFYEKTSECMSQRMEMKS